MGHSLEDGYEQVEQQYVGEQEVDTQQEDGEPLWEDGHMILIQHRAPGLQWVVPIHRAGAVVKLGIWGKALKIKVTTNIEK